MRFYIVSIYALLLGSCGSHSHGDSNKLEEDQTSQNVFSNAPLPFGVDAENHKDSLLLLIAMDESDSSKLLHLNELAYIYRNSFPDSTIYLSNKAISICEKHILNGLPKESTGYSDAIGNLGIAYRLKGDYAKAEFYYHKALEMDQRLQNKFGIGKRLVGISNLYTNMGDFPRALDYGHKALEANSLIDNRRGIALSRSVIGKVYEEMGDYRRALSLQQVAAKAFSDINDVNNITATAYSIGEIYFKLSQFDSSFFFLHRALDCSEKYQLIQEKTDVLNILARLFQARGEADSVITVLSENLLLCEKNNLFASLGETYLNLGSFYSQCFKYELALENLKKASEIFSLRKARRLQLHAENLMASVLYQLGDYHQAMEHLMQANMLRDSIFNVQNSQKMLVLEFDKKALEAQLRQDKINALAEEEMSRQVLLRNVSAVAFAFVLALAAILYKNYRRKQSDNKRIHLQNTRISEQNDMLNVIQNMSNQINSTLDMRMVMEFTYENISRLMDTSFFLINSYNPSSQTTRVIYCVKNGKVVDEMFSTSIHNNESFSALTIKSKTEVVLEDFERDAPKYINVPPKLHGPEDMWTESAIFLPLIIRDEVIGLFSVQSTRKHAYSDTQLNLLRSMSNIIAVALNNSMSYIDLNRAKNEVNEQKIAVEEKNREILDSIEYAKRIQTAILPSPRVVKEFLKDSFILYLPKDIVAGDFYWMESMDGTIYFAACDCTGHGVPGAMVSVVCNNALNRSVNEFALREPGEVFDKVRELVIENFVKSDEDVKDGMDASLCALSINPLRLRWSGANNPLWIYRAANKCIEEIKADKQPIGKAHNPRPFTTHEIALEPGDTIYLFTDGYADQFGGAHNKKFTRARFRELLLSIAHLRMEEQREKLLEHHIAYRGSQEQIDDICVMGVRLS